MDFIFIVFLKALMVWSNRRFVIRHHLSPFYQYVLWALWVYHIAFSVLFYTYIQKHGGDSAAYWTLTADVSQEADSWMGHWGYRTFFIQWLNYIPSEVLGLGFLTGNLLYANLSFFGFRELLVMLSKQVPFNEQTWWGRSWVILLFLPGLHFWTSGVGKEGLLWLGTIWTLRGIVNFPSKGYMIFIGAILSFLVRPINGAILLSIVCLFILVQQQIAFRMKLAVLTILLVMLGLFVIKIHQYTGIDKFTWAAVVEFSDSQLLFLTGYNAGSELPMKEYAWSERIFTVMLRPLWFETRNLWVWAAATENIFSLFIMVGGLIGYLTSRKWCLSPVLSFGLAYAIGLMGVYALTLNNLGIMVRMKSICMIFILLALWPGVYWLFKKGERPTRSLN